MHRNAQCTHKHWIFLRGRFQKHMHFAPCCTILHRFAPFCSILVNALYALCLFQFCVLHIFAMRKLVRTLFVELVQQLLSAAREQERKSRRQCGNAFGIRHRTLSFCKYSHSIPIFFNAFCLTSSWWAVVVRQSSNPFQSFSYLFISLPCFIFAVHSRHSHCMVQVTATGWAETGSFATSARRRTATRAGTCWEPMARYGDMASFWNGDMRQYRHRPSWFIHPCLHCTKTLLRLSGCNSTIPPNFTVSSCRLSRAKRPENLQLLNLLQQQQVRCCLLLDKLGVILLLCNIVRVWIWIML